MRRVGCNHSEGGYSVGDTTYRFIQVRPERFFGTEKVWIGEARVAITNLERTLLDGLSMPQYCGDFAEVLHAFEIGMAQLDLNGSPSMLLRLDAATAKRLGWVLESLGVNPSQVDRLTALPIKGYRKLDSAGPKKGRYNSRWMVQENLPGRIGA